MMVCAAALCVRLWCGLGGSLPFTAPQTTTRLWDPRVPNPQRGPGLGVKTSFLAFGSKVFSCSTTLISSLNY